ncbi:hypothetical protein [Blastococcus haudaquaticus]|uniref:Uncharacterized protein n=1 Tax=Blastococcus haudaquaticus TaxID=1938745 RepID=A0A286H647_9ACTN|nr:hypothetical protein [Blastococcus haudaquaticus]SOE02946.1 hypothetical protein SAMN06272739_3907 [Blastococcus haudaquaticus]
MTVIPLPRHGRWAWDLRGEGRGVRVSAHTEEGMLNLSLWCDGTCVGTARLLPGDVAKLMSGLSEGLAEIAAQPRSASPGNSGSADMHELEERLAHVEARLRATAPRGPGERAGAAVRRLHAVLVIRRPGILGVRTRSRR